MLHGVTAITATQETVQHNVLIHPVGCSPSIKPGLNDFARVTSPKTLNFHKSLIEINDIFKVKLIRSEDLGQPFLKQDFQFVGTRIWENLFHKYGIRVFLHGNFLSVDPLGVISGADWSATRAQKTPRERAIIRNLMMERF